MLSPFICILWYVLLSTSTYLYNQDNTNIFYIIYNLTNLVGHVNFNHCESNYRNMILSINISKYFKILKQMPIKQTSIENIYEKCHMNVSIRNSRPFHICSLYFWIVKLFATNISFYIRCKLSFSITIKVLRVFFLP